MDENKLARYLRLAEIFMPEFSRRRREAYRLQAGAEPQPGAMLRLAHYTSANAALSIIAEKRMWMRNTNCMADYSEILHGHKELLKFFHVENPDRQRLWMQSNIAHQEQQQKRFLFLIVGFLILPEIHT